MIDKSLRANTARLLALAEAKTLVESVAIRLGNPRRGDRIEMQRQLKRALKKLDEGAPEA